jgi:hypothetical protein
MKRLTLTTCLLSMFLVVAPAWSADDEHAADREALLTILGDIEDALNARNLDGALKHLDPEVIITYQDSTVTQGIDGATEYFDRMMEGAGAIVSEFSTVADVGAPAVFHGDTAIAYGTTTDRYVLARGLEMVLNANWSTTLQKQNGEWKVLALHFSTDLFDNPLLNAASRMNWIFGAGGLVLGLLLMWFLGRSRRRSAGA